MEKKLRQLFDYQKFADNKELSDVIALCEDSSDKAEKKDNSNGEKQKGRVLERYKSGILTMTGSAVAAVLLIVFNLFLADTGVVSGPPTAVGSLFAEGKGGYFAAGVIFLLGAVVSFLLYRKNSKK